MRFILPRVIALTAIVGLAALVLSLLFKVLIGATIIMLIVRAAGSRFRRHNIEGMQYGHPYMQFQQGRNSMFGSSQSVTPFRAPWQRPTVPSTQSSGIIPIN